MCIVAPASASALIMREKEERTLAAVLTDISGWRFVMGKLFSSLFFTVIALFSVLPLFMLVVSLGGVSAIQIGMAYVVILGAVFLCGCMGIFAACATRTERSMNSVLAGIWAALFLPDPAGDRGVVSGKEPDTPGEPWQPLVADVGHDERDPWPGNLVRARERAGERGAGPAAPLGGKGAGAARRVQQGVVALAERLREVYRSFRKIRGLMERPPITGNPLIWKDMNFLYGGNRSSWIKFAVFIGGVGLIMLVVS